MATRKITQSKPHRTFVLQLVTLLLVFGETLGQGQFGGLTSPVPRLGGFGNEVPVEDCGNRDIAQCVELLDVLTSKDIGFAASREELNNMCPVLLSGLQCIDNYTLRCLSPQHRSYFNKLYNGTMIVIRDLCTARGSRYQLEYIRHAPCMREVNPKYNQCSEVYHRKTAGLNQAVVRLSERDKARNVITLCCSFQEYLQCSESVVYESCGNETALFTKNFLNRMAGPIVQTKCIQYEPGSRMCNLINGASSPSASTGFMVLLPAVLAGTMTALAARTTTAS